MSDTKKELSFKPKKDGIQIFCAYDELVDPISLVGNPKNPNSHPKEQIELLAKIIKSQGWRAPITVSNRSGFVVRGHGRLAAALLLKTNLVPVDRQDYESEAAEYADLIADNRLAELSIIEDEKIAEILKDIRNFDFDTSLTGYSEEEIQSFFDNINDNIQENDQIDSIEEPKKIAMSKSGDLWILGDHRVLCGDATNREDVERLMDGEKAHLCHTDPPYGVNYKSKSSKFEVIKNDDLDSESLLNRLIVPAFKNLYDFSFDNAVFYIWHASSTRKFFDFALETVGFEENQYLIWVKNAFVFGRADYHWAHEPCYYCSKKKSTKRYFGDRKQQTVWRAVYRGDGQKAYTIGKATQIVSDDGKTLNVVPEIPKDTKIKKIHLKDGDNILLSQTSSSSTVWEISREIDIEHPTQKPVEIPARAIQNSSLEGETVLDLFGGSGSTLIAAEILGRKARLMEIDPQYVDVIVRRYSRLKDDAFCIRNGKKIPFSTLNEENIRQNYENSSEKQK